MKVTRWASGDIEAYVGDETYDLRFANRSYPVESLKLTGKYSHAYGIVWEVEAITNTGAFLVGAYDDYDIAEERLFSEIERMRNDGYMARASAGM